MPGEASRDGKETVASTLRRTARVARPRAGEDCMAGRAESLSELVRLEEDDSEPTAEVNTEIG